MSCRTYVFGALVAAAAVAAAVPAAAQSAGRNCPPYGSVRSINSKAPAEVIFLNFTKIPLTIMWIDFDGQWRKYHTLAPNAAATQRTFGTHPWIAVDDRGNCHGRVMYPNPNSRDGGDNRFEIYD